MQQKTTTLMVCAKTVTTRRVGQKWHLSVTIMRGRCTLRVYARIAILASTIKRRGVQPKTLMKQQLLKYYETDEQGPNRSDSLS